MILVVIFSLVGTSLTISTKAKSLDEIFAYDDYLDKDYSQYANKTHVRDYMDGIIGHKQYIKIGKIQLVAKEVERITTPVLVGDDLSLIMEEVYSYILVNQITLTMSSEITVQTMIDAAVNLKGLADVRVNENYTQKFRLGFDSMYSETLEQAYRITVEKNLSAIPHDKIRYNIGRVAIFLQFEIIESYISELWWWNWHVQNDTIISNYYANFFIDDLVTFVYNDKTFGNSISGIYPLSNNPIKLY